MALPTRGGEPHVPSTGLPARRRAKRSLFIPRRVKLGMATSKPRSRKRGNHTSLPGQMLMPQMMMMCPSPQLVMQQPNMMMGQPQMTTDPTAPDESDESEAESEV